MSMLCLIWPGKARFGGSSPPQLMTAHCFVKSRRDRYSNNVTWNAIAASLLSPDLLGGAFLISSGKLVGDCECFFVDGRLSMNNLRIGSTSMQVLL
jgi:hypothetical protein